MSDLTEYHARRDFTRTAEPPSPQARKRKWKSAAYSYVVQKHAARRLHYDFRLELDGVLLSWAVPKGPSLDPTVKRLAVEVEPHPVEYGGFEGEIAQGQYGAGSVMVWDSGTWEPLDTDPRKAYEKGHLTFAIHGEKLRGAWHLVRTSRGGAKPSWLLFKSNDEHAQDDVDILAREPNSVLSGRSIEQIADGKQPQPRAQRKRSGVTRKDAAEERPVPASPKQRRTKVATAKRNTGASKQRSSVALLEALTKRRDLERTEMPVRVEVQLATLVDEPPLGDGWLHEIKFDGYRVVVKVHDGEVSLWTRKALDWTRRMPALATAMAELSLPNVVIDGEFVALEANGVSNFQTLQNSLGLEHADNLVYYAFDLLHYEGVDTRALPLRERKALLKELLVSRLQRAPEGLVSRVRLSEHVEGSGREFFEQACKLGLEGIVSKRADASCTAGRSRDWLKLKCSKRQEFVIVGYTEPAGSRAHLGALLLGVYDRDELVYCGRVGTGFSIKSLAMLEAKLSPLQVNNLDLQNRPKGAHARGVHWVEPKLVAEVAYIGFTDEGVLRHPTFEGLREDKSPREVRREVVDSAAAKQAVASSSTTEASRTPRTKAIDVSHVKITNPTKVLYPTVGVTKRDLLEYAGLVAERLLPHVVGRPLTLVRCPNGENKHCFFQKHPGGSAEGLRAVGIREKEGKADYAVIDGVDGLFSLVQMGVLEIHTSGAHADDFEHPDVLVFDLDPDPSVEFREVIRCARRLKEIFDSADLESFVKSTGGKGLHVCVPVEPKLSWSQAKLFTQHIANALVKEEPKRYVATQSKAQRVGKIFIDYLRNGRGATFVAPYSTRARPTAPVATPLFWDELTDALTPDRFTVDNLKDRLSQLAEDPFARMATLHQKLPGDLFED